MGQAQRFIDDKVDIIRLHDNGFIYLNKVSCSTGIVGFGIKLDYNPTRFVEDSESYVSEQLDAHMVYEKRAEDYLVLDLLTHTKV